MMMFTDEVERERRARTILTCLATADREEQIAEAVFLSVEDVRVTLDWLKDRRRVANVQMVGDPKPRWIRTEVP
jgi:hypothetical protein